MAAVDSMAPNLVHHTRGEVWTTTKVMRRLAWHEPGELDVMRHLVQRAHTARQEAPNSHPGA